MWTSGSFLCGGPRDEAAYALETQAGDVTAVLDAVGVARDAEINRTWLRDVAAAGGGAALAKAIEAIAGTVSPGYAERLARADLDVYIASVPSSATMADMLPAMTMPCCVYCGDADPMFAQARLSAEMIPNAQFIALPGLAHLPAFNDSRAVLPPVMAFLAAAAVR